MTMLSDDAIDRLIQPIIDRQESINTFVLNMIAERIKQIGTIKISDVYRLERLLKSGADVQKINAELARITGMQVRQIKNIIRTVALDSYIDVKPYYDYRRVPYIPFSKNEQLQRVVATIANQTANTYTNLANSKALGFMVRDLKHPGKLKFQSIKDTYNSVMDEAIQTVQSGTFDYNTVMRRTMRQLVDSGVRRLYWESGYTQRLDSVVRRNLMDGIRAINQGVQDEVGKQYNADGKELSAHPYSAPDHEPFQGRQFTNAEFEKLQNGENFKDVNGKQFMAVERAIGMWNCRHFAFSIIIGVFKPNYSEKQLQAWEKENAKGYTTKNGKHFTMYECRQYLNQLATKVRYAKDGQMVAKEAGDITLAKEYDARVARYSKQYNAFAKQCGLPRRARDLYVNGYQKVS